MVWHQEAASIMLFGDSPKTRDILERSLKIAETDAPVLITGESGTGKSTLAHMIHAASKRANANFIHVNCATVPDNLLESELFGHVKGAFTGADANKKGLFELAHGGTLFLDEISEFSLAAQSKLLLAIQEGEFRPLGSQTSMKVDVRIISASNKDLQAEIKAGRFREDLYYRLQVAMVRCPALRERVTDIPQLAVYLIQTLAKNYQTPAKELSPEVLEAFQTYNWPGNIRELSNLIGHLLIFGDNPISLENLPEKLRKPGAEALLSETVDVQNFDKIIPWRVFKKKVQMQAKKQEREYLLWGLQQCGGNVSELARLLEVRRTTIYKWFATHGIDDRSKG